VLLDSAGWGDAAQQRVRLLYETLAADRAMPSPFATSALLVELGVARERAPQHVLAMMRTPPAGRWLINEDDGIEFDDFLLGLVAMDPSTAHGGI